jgi:hypothetical protein
METIKKLYSEHLEASFPDGLRGVEAAGQELVMLDADIAGCISTYLHNNGILDNQRIEILKNIDSKMDTVIAEIPQNAKEYFLRLKLLCELTLKELSTL